MASEEVGRDNIEVFAPSRWNLALDRGIVSSLAMVLLAPAVAAAGAPTVAIACGFGGALLTAAFARGAWRDLQATPRQVVVGRHGLSVTHTDGRLSAQPWSVLRQTDRQGRELRLDFGLQQIQLTGEAFDASRWAALCEAIQEASARGSGLHALRTPTAGELADTSEVA